MPGLVEMPGPVETPGLVETPGPVEMPVSVETPGLVETPGPGVSTEGGGDKWRFAAASAVWSLLYEEIVYYGTVAKSDRCVSGVCL